MKKKTLALVLTITLLVISVLLAACGDSTNTPAPAATSGSGAGASRVATSAAASASSTTMAGANMSSMTLSPAASASTNATTAAGMPGHDGGAMTTAAAGSAMNNMGSDAMTDSLKSLSGAQFEIKFMQSMIVHHQSAIDMAKLVPTNTRRPELLKLAQDIITAQTKEIGDMTGWLTSWHNTKPVAASEQGSMPGMSSMMGQMDGLKKAKDADFDKMFVNMMILHHQSAVNMANLIPGKTQRPELIKLGQDIIKTQTAEIEQMTGWQKAWFPA